MKKNYILLFVGTFSLIISLIWGISKNQVFEPWTAVLSSISYILGIYFSIPESKSQDKKVTQSNFFGFFNSSIVKAFTNKVKQLNFFSIGNKQVIDTTKEIKRRTKS